MIKIILYVVAALGVTVGALTITGAGDDRSSTPTITTLPLSLLACNRAAEGEQSGTRVRLGEHWDGVAAVSAGFRTFWIQRTTAEVPEELGFQVDVTVRPSPSSPSFCAPKRNCGGSNE
jgi:hypothetical protein